MGVSADDSNTDSTVSGEEPPWLWVAPNKNLPAWMYTKANKKEVCQ